MLNGTTLYQQVDEGLLYKLVTVMERAFPLEHGERWSAMQIRSMLASPLAWLVVADRLDDPAKMAGFALGRSVADEVEIMLLGVDPDMRRQGIAGKIMKMVEQEAILRDIETIFVEVRENNPARLFYENIGFSIIGRRPNYYTNSDGSRVTALTMSKAL